MLATYLSGPEELPAWGFHNMLVRCSYTVLEHNLAFSGMSLRLSSLFVCSVWSERTTPGTLVVVHFIRGNIFQCLIG